MAVRKSTRLLLWISALGILIAVAIVVAVGLLMWDKPSTISGGKRWMAMTLSGKINDGPMPDDFSFDPEDIELTTHDLAAILHAAADDEDIEGLELRLDSPSLSMAGVQELRAGLRAIKEAGKPCIAWSKSYENLTWYLASACGDIRMHPEGVPLVLGLNVSTEYFSGTLEKLGVQADFERVGAYKSAIETFEETAPSEASVEMYTTLLDSLYGNFVRDLAVDHQVTEDEIRALIDDPPVTATTAIERGLIDQLMYEDELDDLHEEEDEPITAKKYARSLRSKWRSADHTVAVLHLQGQVIDGDSSGGGFGGSSIGDRTVVKALKELEEDEDIDAVVLRVDSPGGSALASDVIWRAVKRLDEKKPVVASMGSVAASGGYYIAMAARHIVAQPSTVTGSIGVFAGKFAMNGLFEKVGVSTWTLRRGALAGLLVSPDPFTDAERAKLRERIEDFYRVFITKAAEGRSRTPEEIHEVAQGRVWTGAQALEVGLVDELGGLDRAVLLAKELASIPDDASVGRHVLPEQSTFMEMLLSKSGGGLMQQQALEQQALVESLGPETAQTLLQARSLMQMSEHGALLAWEPVTIRIH